MIDCISTTPELTDLNLPLLNDENLYLNVLTPATPTSKAIESNLKAIDFDPFIDGEILLTAPATESQQEIWLGVQQIGRAHV